MVIFRKGEGTANFSLKDPDPINSKYFISADEFLPVGSRSLYPYPSNLELI